MRSLVVVSEIWKCRGSGAQGGRRTWRQYKLMSPLKRGCSTHPVVLRFLAPNHQASGWVCKYPSLGKRSCREGTRSGCCLSPSTCLSAQVHSKALARERTYSSRNEMSCEDCASVRHHTWQHRCCGAGPADAFFDCGAQSWDGFQGVHVRRPACES